MKDFVRNWKAVAKIGTAVNGLWKSLYRADTIEMAEHLIDIYNRSKAMLDRINAEKF